MKQILFKLKSQIIPVTISLCLVVLTLCYSTGNIPLPFIDRLEYASYDARLNMTMPNTIDNNIVIVDIDEKSLKEIGRFPWSRNKVSLLVEQLFEHYEANLVGFDIVFAEPDTSSGYSVLKELADTKLQHITSFKTELENLKNELDYDQEFADNIKNRRVVLGYTFTESTDDDASAGVLPPPVISKKESELENTAMTIKVAGYSGNLKVLQDSALSAGHFNADNDVDGVIRRVPLLYEYEDNYYESLALSIVRNLLGVSNVGIETQALGASNNAERVLEWVTVGNLRIPVDLRAQALVPYRGKQASFPYVSATDVIHGRADKAILKNTIVLVGTTAKGLFDLRVTPVQKIYPGVEVHANLISGILDQSIKQQPASLVFGIEFILILLTGVLLALLVPFLSPIWATLLFLGTIVLHILFNLYLWQYGNIVLSIAPMITMILVMYLVSMSYGFFITSRGKKQIEGLFGQYIPPELVDEMTEDPAAYGVEAETRELTALFSDVRGFTDLSEGMGAEELAKLMNAYLTPMTRVIHKRRGTIDKYMGDAIMAFWGAPIADNDHARHALFAALEMDEALATLNQDFVKKGWPQIKVGIGLNSGEMSVGNMGSEFRMAYTIMGDAVNLGSRLEGLTKAYGVSVIVSETVYERVPEVVYRELDKVRVKGKKKPVTIYEPIGLKEEITKEQRAELKLYMQTLAVYRKQQWDQAELQFLNLKQQSQNKTLYDLYISRIQAYRNTPPEQNWDGVFTFQTK